MEYFAKLRDSYETGYEKGKSEILAAVAQAFVAEDLTRGWLGNARLYRGRLPLRLRCIFA